MSNVGWTELTLDKQTRQAIEELLVEFQGIDARHRLDIGLCDQCDLKLKLTPIDESPADSQNHSTPIDMQEDILVELAPLHKYGIITTLPFSKTSRPIFAQTKLNDKLRLLVNLRKIKNLILENYVNNNRPVSTPTNVTQHMAGKNYFVKLTVPKHITVYRWQISDLWKCFHFILPARLLLNED